MAGATEARTLLQASPHLPAAVVGAAVGVAAGLVTAAVRSNDDDGGNVISGDVSIHLLNRIELLTIRLQIRHGRKAAPTEIDVHRVAGAG